MHHFQTHPHHWLPIGSERGVLPTFHRAGTFANFLQTWRRHQKPMIDHHSLYSLNYKKEMVWSLSQTAYPYNHRVLRYQAITGVLSHPFSLRPYHFDVFEVLKGGTLGTLHSKKTPFPDKQPMFCLTCHLVGG